MPKEPNENTIRYDREREMWCLKNQMGSFPLHCGEMFGLAIGADWLSCRLELDTSWYVILKDTKFILHPRTEYGVRM